jgi:hypothetical protein
MSLLRSASWADALGGDVGDFVFVELPEIGIQGWAILQRIMTVAPPRAGPGCTVIATFRRSSEVVQVHLSGYRALIVTRRHPLFSQSRGDWVAADALEPGQLLRTRTGTVQVEFVDRADDDDLPVYNLEVPGSTSTSWEKQASRRTTRMRAGQGDESAAPKPQRKE